MVFLQFKNTFYGLVCFSIHQVYAWRPDFDRNNLTRWTKMGLLVRLRQSWYTFPEYAGLSDYSLYFANRIYQPSYISLFTALSFYGMIPETIVQTSSVSTLKTATFSSGMGTYSYQHLSPVHFFGYELKPMPDGRHLKIAQPEKALIDLIYLYPFYNTVNELLELRLDEYFLQESFNHSLFKEYLSKMNVKALERRIVLLNKAYGL